MHSSAAVRQILLLMGAAAAFTTAAVLIFSIGLPDRADVNALYRVNGIPVAAEIGAAAPPIQSATLSGEPFSLTQLLGKPVVINFWATWCAPCEAEMPALQALFEGYREQGLRVIAVNMGESPEVIRPWVRARDLTFDIILDQNDAIAAMYQLLGQPSTFILDRQHRITAIFYGPAPLERLQNTLDAVN